LKQIPPELTTFSLNLEYKLNACQKISGSVIEVGGRGVEEFAGILTRLKFRDVLVMLMGG
tara:strand:- start:1860 stop:2039 length:180 start_codon:yes stop_codon:yes gene_type:complete